MPQIVDSVPTTPYESTPKRIRWTRRQAEAMREAGILTGQYELIDGEIISKMGQNPPQRVSVVLLRECLVAIFGGLHVQVQATIEVGDADPDHNEPEPDAAVTAQPQTAYPDRHPASEDLLLVAEVSDTTVRFDRGKKAALYARAGIREYWVLDVPARKLFVHREPFPDGYREIVQYAAEESVAPLARPEAAVLVADLLPPVD
jgi:Uma2 family endonuclease